MILTMSYSINYNTKIYTNLRLAGTFEFFMAIHSKTKFNIALSIIYQLSKS